jgi:hypothetical protein
MLDRSVISSTLLGLNAYAKAQGKMPAAKLPAAKHRAYVPPRAKPQSPDRVVEARSKKDTKEMKLSVLKSLQAQSNSGLVKIRDVSSALDALLKNS